MQRPRRLRMQWLRPLQMDIAPVTFTPREQRRWQQIKWEMLWFKILG